MNQTGSPSITTLITHIVLQEHCEPLSQNLDAVKKPLILNKPTHHIMHVVYQQALCKSLYSTFSVSPLNFPGWHYAPFTQSCFFLIQLVLFFRLFFFSLSLGCFHQKSIPLLILIIILFSFIPLIYFPLHSSRPSFLAHSSLPFSLLSLLFNFIIPRRHRSW